MIGGSRWSRAGRDVLLDLSRYGEKHGWDWLTYHPGLFVFFHYMAAKNARPFVASIQDVFPSAGRLAAGTTAAVLPMRSANATVPTTPTRAKRKCAGPSAEAQPARSRLLSKRAAGGRQASRSALPDRDPLSEDGGPRVTDSSR
jgi:hypothetical protein